MISLVTKQKVILKHLENYSNREIAKDLGIDKNTVNKYVKEYDKKLKELVDKESGVDPEVLIADIIEAPAYNCRNRGPRTSTVEAKEEIKQCLAENEKKRLSGRGKQQMRATDIHGYLIKKGFDISYSTVKKLVSSLKDTHDEAFIRQEQLPGQVCEFDWGEVKLNIGGSGYHKYQMAAFATSYGNYRYAQLYRSQDTAAFQEAHAGFFRFCHGSYHTVVYDNMKVAVKKFVGPTEKEPTDALTQLSVYYRFNYRFCNVRRGNEKSHVERTVDVMRHYAFSNPGEDVFDTLEAANAHLLKKCREKNLEALSDGRIPAETFLEEKPFLVPEVPEMPCFVSRSGCRVDKYSTIAVNNVRYSVPDIYVNKRVDVRVYTDKIVVYKDLKTVAEHPRSFQQGSYHLDIFHYLHTLKRKPGALPQSTALLQSDTRIKNIYEKYYTSDPKTFLYVLDIIKFAGADEVYRAIEEISGISPGDLSADKITAVINSSKHNQTIMPGSGNSQLSNKIKGTLGQYDRLMKAMNQERQVAV